MVLFFTDIVITDSYDSLCLRQMETAGDIRDLSPGPSWRPAFSGFSESSNRPDLRHESPKDPLNQLNSC